jgi:hypothetical protein
MSLHPPRYPELDLGETVAALSLSPVTATHTSPSEVRGRRGRGYTVGGGAGGRGEAQLSVIGADFPAILPL